MIDEQERFRDRRDAGRQLAEKLSAYANRPDVLVLGLPRGGVPVAYEVAKVLNAPLDVFLVRKLGVPGHEELAMGAIASGSVRVLNKNVVQSLRLSDQTIEAVAAAEQRTLVRREWVYRAVGLWYQDFSQTSDEEVRALLEHAAQPTTASTVSHSI